MASIYRSSFTNEKNVFHFASGNEVGHNLSVTNAAIQADANGKKTVPEGLFVALVGADYRYLPRATVTTAVSASSPTVVATPSQIFKVGDVLYSVEPTATVTLTGTVAAAETVTVTIGGIAVVTTAVTTVLADLIALTAANINASPNLAGTIRAIVSGGIIYLYVVDGVTRPTLTISDVSSAIGSAVSGAVFDYQATLGTVSAIVASTNTITLAANAAYVVPVGGHIGVKVSEVYGLDSHQRDFTIYTTQEFGVYNASSGVRENILPYIDGDLKRRFPKMLFSSKV